MTRDHRHFTRELSWAMACHKPFAIHVRLNNLHTPGQQDEESNIAVVCAEQDVAPFHLPQGCEGPNSIDLRLGQCWKHLSVAFKRVEYEIRNHLRSLGTPLTWAARKALSTANTAAARSIHHTALGWMLFRTVLSQ